jgi:mannose-6-phosphate isomerase-like protein (cupin superfamily)
MSSFSIVNLRELPDVVGDRAPEIEGRFSRSAIESRDLGVSLWEYQPSYRSATGHRHGVQEEAYVVVRGSGRVLLDGEIREVGPWDVVRVAPEVFRAWESGPEGLDLIVVGGPRPEEGDGEPGPAEWPGG